MTQLLQEMMPYILGILGVLGTYLGARFNAYIGAKISKENMNSILVVVKASVEWVDQITGKDLEMEGQEKFQMAKDRALIWLNEKGLEVTDVELETLIEKFVREIKLERGE